MTTANYVQIRTKTQQLINFVAFPNKRIQYYPLYCDYTKYFEKNYPLYSDYMKYFCKTLIHYIPITWSTSEKNYPIIKNWPNIIQNKYIM